MNKVSVDTEQHDPLDLLLDPYNPRLTVDEEGASQPELLRIILERFKIEELAQSISAAGYLPFDPLIGCQQEQDVVILEGNRRVATLKLLLDPSLAPEKYRRRWEELKAGLSEKVRESISSIEVMVFPDREDAGLESYIGFRHVTGVLQWPALEKASFISRLIDLGWNYATIAERLGSYPKTVEKHYVGYRIVEQARSLGLPGAEQLAGTFGVLMRALQSPGVAAFLGLSFPHDPLQSKDPVPPHFHDNFRQFIEWTFGTDEKPRIIRDSRQLTRWGKILASSDAVSYLRRSGSPAFERAWFKSGGESESLMDSLLKATDYLEESIPLIPLHKDDPDIKSAVARCTQFMMQILRDFSELREKYEVRGIV
jgi:ParB-like nuclease family protein